MIYFDNSATTKPYKEVLHTFTKVNEQLFANPSSIHSFGGKVEKLMQQAREQVASLLHVQGKEIIFTSGGTESNNLAIKGAALRYRNRGKHLITLKIEHPSVLNAFKQLEEFGYSVTYLDVDESGKVDPAMVEKEIREDTILISIMHVNNEVGTIQPIMKISEILQRYPKVIFHVDHVQGCGKVPLEMKHSRIDLCTISAHKVHGLKGTGLLYKRDGINLSPILTGGEQEANIRSGTENVGGIASFAKALRLHFSKTENDIKKMFDIQRYLRDELEKLDGVIIHTPKADQAPHIINFSVKHFKAEVLVHALDKHEIFVSTTSACSSKQSKPSRTLLSMGVPLEIAESSLRISLSFENTLEEAKQFLQVFNTEINSLMKTMRRSK
jgi:cysteine desulfurase